VQFSNDERVVFVADIGRYYFRSTMEELQNSAAREAVDAAQASVDSCTRKLQSLTKGCGDAFAKLGEVESAWFVSTVSTPVSNLPMYIFPRCQPWVHNACVH
jgi:hypothetical protein